MSIEDRPTTGAERENDDLIRELRAIRPRPHEGFRRQLDDRAAGGFPPRRPGHVRDGGPSDNVPARDSNRRGLGERFGLSGRFRFGPILAGAAVACAVATAVVVTDPGPLGSGDDKAASLSVTASDAGAVPGQSMEGGGGGTTHNDAGSMAEQPALGATESAPESSGLGQYDEMAIEQAPRGTADRQSRSVEPMPVPPGAPGAPIAADRGQRSVERDASITLATEPPEVPEVAAGVLRVVAGHSGIVLSSSTRGGAEGEAGADFNLKIPSSNLSQALAELSDLAVVRDRRESTLDITAPTVSTADRLREARAEVRGLLKQMAEATSDSEREAIQVDLRPAQRRVAELRAQLDRLGRRASYADVRVSIVTGEAGALPEEDEWTLAQAADDALRILTVVVGILIVAAAILVPIALIALLTWAARRAWIRRARERALSGDQPS